MVLFLFFFFFNDPAPPEISPLPLHDPLPIGERAAQSRRALAASREIVLQARRVPLPPRLVGAPATGRRDTAERPGTRHKRSGYELGAVAVVALRRVAGGLRRAIAVTAALTLAGVGGPLLGLPRILSH